MSAPAKRASPIASAAWSVSSQAEGETGSHHSPFLFVPNVGQFDLRVRFQLRGAGGVWWFTDDALWLTVLKHNERWTTDDGRQRGGRPSSSVFGPASSVGVHLRFTFPGISLTARRVASDPPPPRMNHFLGNDAAKWRTNVPAYGTLRWEGAYPGVNLVFGRDGAGLALTAEAASDAALAALQLRIKGADAMRVDASGRLIADTAIGPVALLP